MSTQVQGRGGTLTDPHPAQKKTRSAWLLATFFGAGYLKPGPGTYGSVAAVLLWMGAAHLLHGSLAALRVFTFGAALLATLLGIPAATRVARESGREDPGFVVIDEVAGQWLALLFVPANWYGAAVGLLLFRLFDILKPPPVRQLEALPEGTGIMLDDLAAGAIAAALGALVFALARHYG